MNEKQVEQRLRELYDFDSDVVVQDYVNDLSSGFEPVAYENMRDGDLIEDVERYREAVREHYLNPAPRFSKKIKDPLKIATLILQLWAAGDFGDLGNDEDSDPIENELYYAIIKALGNDITRYHESNNIYEAVAKDFWLISK
jgi:hypothetical protein